MNVNTDGRRTLRSIATAVAGGAIIARCWAPGCLRSCRSGVTVHTHCFLSLGASVCETAGAAGTDRRAAPLLLLHIIMLACVIRDK